MNLRGYTVELASIVASIPESKRQSFLTAFQSSEKNPTLLFGFNAWLGWLGIDRFLVGDIVAGILKLITIGGFGLWVLIDYFLIGSRARAKNIEFARQLKASFSSESASSAPTASTAPPASPED